MEDHTKITGEDTKVRSRVGMLIRAVFMEGKVVTSENIM